MLAETAQATNRQSRELLLVLDWRRETDKRPSKPQKDVTPAAADAVAPTDIPLGGLLAVASSTLLSLLVNLKTQARRSSVSVLYTGPKTGSSSSMSNMRMNPAFPRSKRSAANKAVDNEIRHLSKLWSLLWRLR